MAKIKNPVLFSDYVGQPEHVFKALSVFNPMLNVDTKLFIDPLLLSASFFPEIRDAEKTYQNYFNELVKLLSKSKVEKDAPWREAERRFNFPEIQGTCLGYSAASTDGSSFGPELANRTIKTAKEIIDLGITDPDLFLMIPLFEKDIGPDRISDMVTNIIFQNLMDFNSRVINELSLPKEEFVINGQKFLLVNLNSF